MMRHSIMRVFYIKKLSEISPLDGNKPLDAFDIYKKFDEASYHDNKLK